MKLEGKMLSTLIGSYEIYCVNPINEDLFGIIKGFCDTPVKTLVCDESKHHIEEDGQYEVVDASDHTSEREDRDIIYVVDLKNKSHQNIRRGVMGSIISESKYPVLVRCDRKDLSAFRGFSIIHQERDQVLIIK